MTFEMKQKGFLLLLTAMAFSACAGTKKMSENTEKSMNSTWNQETLNQRAVHNLDRSSWDLKLYQQDIETYLKYAEVFQSFPLNKSPFPVSEYDYAVASNPFILETDGKLFKGVSIGEYENPDSEKVIDKLTLLILTNNKDSEENTLVESRNYPYLTAQGTFKVSNNEYDWVFSASPDGYANLLINMKLFDLRFGETIIIFPQEDRSFLYLQIKDSPNNYKDFEDFKRAVLQNEQVKLQLNSSLNIK